MHRCIMASLYSVAPLGLRAYMISNQWRREALRHWLPSAAPLALVDRRIAKRARVQGKVVVQITIDEEGRVTSATALSGHPLLRAASVQAARQATFFPTILSGQPVKVSGSLTYNFSLPEIENDPLTFNQ